MNDIPEILFTIMDATHDARKAGHTEVEIARAAGIEVSPNTCRCSEPRNEATVSGMSS